MSIRTIDCIVPVYNEEKSILKVILDLLKIKELGKVIIVDDGSEDGTGREIIKVRNGRLVKVFKKHGGKGSAVKEGLKYVESEYVFLQDADLEYPVHNFYLLYPYVGTYPVVVGERLFPISKMSLRSFLANKLFVHLLSVPDVFSGQRIVKTEILKKIPLKDGFEIETQITLYCKRNRVPIKYVPVPYYPRRWEEKKIGFVDFLKILWEVAHGNFGYLRKEATI